MNKIPCSDLKIRFSFMNDIDFKNTFSVIPVPNQSRMSEPPGGAAFGFQRFDAEKIHNFIDIIEWNLWYIHMGQTL